MTYQSRMDRHGLQKLTTKFVQDRGPARIIRHCKNAVIRLLKVHPENNNGELTVLESFLNNAFEMETVEDLLCDPDLRPWEAVAVVLVQQDYLFDQPRKAVERNADMVIQLAIVASRLLT